MLEPKYICFFEELTIRENEILRLMIQCYTCIELSTKLNLSIHTVKTHRKNILQKLNCKNVSLLISRYGKYYY